MSPPNRESRNLFLVHRTSRTERVNGTAAVQHYFQFASIKAFFTAAAAPRIRLASSPNKFPARASNARRAPETCQLSQIMPSRVQRYSN